MFFSDGVEVEVDVDDSADGIACDNELAFNRSSSFSARVLSLVATIFLFLMVSKLSRSHTTCDGGLITETIEDGGKGVFCFDGGSACRPLVAGGISVSNYR
ncbi:MAG: hypothetical protein BYD32DRAFT_432963 [Podila humilis]|nr:MAG: hypothetical protein BYD32DRAFT_432963 [Podila humilis]